jgi:hypothetical protein
LERLIAGYGGFWREVRRAAWQAVVWIALPLGLVAVLPILIVVFRELASIDVPLRNLRDVLTAICIACPALAGVILLRLRLERRPAWGSDAIVAFMVAGIFLSRAAFGGVALPEVLLAGYAMGSLLFDCNATWRPTIALAGRRHTVGYKLR